MLIAQHARIKTVKRSMISCASNTSESVLFASLQASIERGNSAPAASSQPRSYSCALAASLLGIVDAIVKSRITRRAIKLFVQLYAKTMRTRFK